MSGYVRVYKTGSSEICSGPMKTTKTCIASFLASASVAIQELAIRSSVERGDIDEESGLERCCDAHVMLAMGLSSLSVGKSLAVVRSVAESAASSIETRTFDFLYGPLVQNLLSKNPGYLRMTFGDDLRGTEIYSDSTSLSEYVLSEQGRYLFDESIASNEITNILDSCRPPASKRDSFRVAVGGAWILSRFGEFSRFTDESGGRSFSIYIDGPALSEALCRGAAVKPPKGIVVVRDMRSTGGQTAFEDDIVESSGKVVQYRIDDANSPLCADVIRRRHPGSVVVLDHGIRSEPFQGLDCMRTVPGMDLEKVLRYGASYLDVEAAENLVRLRDEYGRDRLDEVVLPRIESRIRGAGGNL